jgi:CRP/FNR family transcriptional regulator, cyclic AMP receptor protein
MNETKLVNMLKDIRFLNGVSREHLEQIAAVAEIHDYGDQEIVFREGEIADGVYFVVSGRLTLELAHSTMECKHLVTVGPGEMLGWSSLFEQPRFAATAVVAEPTKLIRVDAARLRAICQEDPSFGYEFMRRTSLGLAKRLLTTWRELSHVHVSHYVPMSAPTDDSNR